MGSAGRRRRQWSSRASLEVQLEGLEGKLRIVLEGARDLPGYGVRRDLASDLDEQVAVLVLEYEVDREGRLERVVVLVGQIDDAGQWAIQKRRVDVDRADFRCVRAPDILVVEGDRL